MWVSLAERARSISRENLRVMSHWTLQSRICIPQKWQIVPLGFLVVFSFIVYFRHNENWADKEIRRPLPWELGGMKFHAKDAGIDGKSAVGGPNTQANTFDEHKIQQGKGSWIEGVVSKMLPRLYSDRQRYKETCSHKWQKEYKSLHKDILEGRRPRKFIVFTCKEQEYGCSGYGNRLAALTSLLYLSILTQRAFLIEWDVDAGVPLERYLSTNNIAWNYPVKELQELKTRKHLWAKYGPKRNGTFNVIGSKAKLAAWLKKTDLRAFFDRPVEKVVGMWYFVDVLLKNEFLKNRAIELGISSRGTYYSFIGCAFEFLFQKTRTLEERLESTRNSLSLERSAFKIGIQVRMGDISFGKSLQYNDINYKDFFNCAQALSEAISTRNQTRFMKRRIRWFLATDDIKVKKFAIENYSANTVTQMITPQHITRLTMLTRSESVESMLDIIVDHLLLSECTFLILSRGSTFGKTAAALAFHSAETLTFGTICAKMARNEHRNENHK
ncbi:uncharacterized protein [Montipora capricornis]|uniref:uncharacterized protein isoform X1 n=2 Tax=Montipora TaxID=46703 RepID=UPI0035F1488F